MSDQKAILIGFTPTHLIPMLEIARELRQPLHFFHPEASHLDAGAWAGRLQFMGACNEPGRSRISKYFFAARELKRLLKKGKEAAVYVPHPFNPLSNYAFFAPAATSVFIYQDGILNYYDAGNPLDSLRAILGRRVRAAAIGLPFRRYMGHLSGRDAREIAGGYFTHPDKIAGVERFPQVRRLDFDAGIPGTAIRTRTNNGCTLFLDQPVERIVDQEMANELRGKASRFADGLGMPVLYKPHYTQGRMMSISAGWRSLAREERQLPAEMLLVKHDIRAVVSFFSSALVNIHLVHPDVCCYAIGASNIPVKIDGRSVTMAELLGGLGVVTID